MPLYVRNADVEAAPMMQETILYSPAAKQFCVLNPTAALIWERLAQPASLAVLAASLRERFDTGAGTDVDGDVQATLQRFESLSLVRQVDGV